ncbi:alpha/beta hydrolase family protein [Nocardia bovistercoris]|uniref:Alpha/beta hydrolase n=1 Tax=Nocardia bovistercoris TaxID=2785916 RepID=A0A931N0K8_9NOCA|nr:alpha/beta fold hydrolase [Nocardia bovistercoris]MBH0775099.1 alpha/beta hydrolase [Nocardia bovistercoris]
MALNSPERVRLKPSSSARVAVALPGTGSDAEFARSAFGPACAAAGLELIAVEPDPLGVVASYRAALEAAASTGPIFATGISLGAAVALEWAAEHPGSTAGVIAALPAWTGTDTADCPAALSAAFTARQLRADGLDAVVERMRATSPRWLGDTLARSWRAQWPLLPSALEEVAGYPWPGTGRLATAGIPVAVVAATDDAVHPIEVGEQWARLLPTAALRRITLDELGDDPAILGRLGFAAFGFPVVDGGEPLG